MDGGDDFMATGNMLCGSPDVHSELLEVVGARRDRWHNADTGKSQSAE